eukprot:CAMPEP_0119299362 /NCGR_PEP_ID=MMETSP1333-20130426/1442_1 /TAXON_ID=418940 /ORGANISM="Scyphosphaera apsteinii, Strain RCC1455" /LENGTH=663 /DNA_ID=CAMNT_0007300765 /DNA_START=165 /DNA_END=2156 /DNA_ORIENTATION=-
MMVVQIWQAGVVYRACQVIIMVYILWDLVQSEQYVQHLLPEGTINTWIEPGSMSRKNQVPQYCANQDLYALSKSFVMDFPICRKHPYNELFLKTPKSVAVTCSYIEETRTGWPCAASDASSRAAACISRGGAVSEDRLQCECIKMQAFYPSGIEDLDVVFQHFYALDTPGDSFEVKGNSLYDLDTTLIAYNGSEVKYKAGSKIAIRLSELLQLANVSLDELNPSVASDYRNDSVYPRFRSTGVRIDIGLHYNNRVGITRRPSLAITSRDVEQKMKAYAHIGSPSLGWSTIGPTPSFREHPVGPEGNATYVKVSNYNMVVLVKFTTTGKVFRFKFHYFLVALIGSFVLMTVARSFTDALSCYAIDFWAKGGMQLAASSQVMIKKKFERVSLDHGLCMQGLRAAIGVKVFQELDCDRDGIITKKDLKKVLQQKINPLAARRIAHAIMQVGDDDDDGELSLDFAEFLTVLETDTVPFSKYLSIVKTGKLLLGSSERLFGTHLESNAVDMEDTAGDIEENVDNKCVVYRHADACVDVGAEPNDAKAEHDVKAERDSASTDWCSTRNGRVQFVEMEDKDARKMAVAAFDVGGGDDAQQTMGVRENGQAQTKIVDDVRAQNVLGGKRVHSACFANLPFLRIIYLHMRIAYAHVRIAYTHAVRMFTSATR